MTSILHVDCVDTKNCKQVNIRMGHFAFERKCADLAFHKPTAFGISGKAVGSKKSDDAPVR